MGAVRGRQIDYSPIRLRLGRLGDGLLWAHFGPVWAWPTNGLMGDPSRGMLKTRTPSPKRKGALNPGRETQQQILRQIASMLRGWRSVGPAEQPIPKAPLRDRYLIPRPRHPRRNLSFPPQNGRRVVTRLNGRE